MFLIALYLVSVCDSLQLKEPMYWESKLCLAMVLQVSIDRNYLLPVQLLKCYIFLIFAQRNHSGTVSSYGLCFMFSEKALFCTIQMVHTLISTIACNCLVKHLCNYTLSMTTCVHVYHVYIYAVEITFCISVHIKF